MSFQNIPQWLCWHALIGVFFWVLAGLPAPADEPIVRSTFHCLSLYWSRPDAGVCTVDYRRIPVGESVKGNEGWLKAQALWYDTQTGTRLTNQYRGSIVNLTPGTEYEVRLQAGNEGKIIRGSTWNEDFKIKKTIRVASTHTPFKTTEAGDADAGYVLYDGTGQTLDLEGNGRNGVNIEHSFVILRGLTIKGAGQNGVSVGGGVSNVVVEGCDISGWGRLETRPDKKSGFIPPAADRIACAEDAGVSLSLDCSRVVVQRCKIHHPRYRAAIWNQYPKYRDGHPNGALAVKIGKNDKASWEANHVIRYNECYSEPDRSFDDTIGGWLNYSHTGVPGADSDIYCNIIRHAADDLIEADGGGQNVRIWGNYLDGGLTAVSFQSLTVGPAYFFRNVIAHGIKPIVPSKGPSHNIFKLVGNNTNFPSFNKRYGDARFCGPIYIYHNTSLLTNEYGFQNAFSAHPADHTRNVISRNNILMTAGDYVNDMREPADFVTSSFDYDLHNGGINVNHPLEGSDAHGIRTLPQWQPVHGTVVDNPLPTTNRGKYQLNPGSSGHNQGVPLDNFNHGAAEEGGGPDMGAHENGTSDLQFGIKANWKP